MEYSLNKKANAEMFHKMLDDLMIDPEFNQRLQEEQRIIKESKDKIKKEVDKEKALKRKEQRLERKRQTQIEKSLSGGERVLTLEMLKKIT
jgi:uncharacterized protein YdaU (DUF1376 family)